MADGRRTELIEGVDGPRLAKLATDHHGRQLIAQEAARLDAARHPGVVELVHQADDRIELAWAGDRTIELAEFDLDGAAALLAALTATVADLHDLGIVHGRLDLTHVIVGPDGSPRLCGMRGPGPGDLDPDPGPTADVAALGRIIHRLVGDGISEEPIPERRWRRRRWSGYQQRALQNLADQAQADDVELRPAARTLATSITEVVPGARLIRPVVNPPEPGERLDPPHESEDEVEVEVEVENPVAVAKDRRPPRSRLAAGAAVAVATLVAFAVVGTHRPDPPSSKAAPALATDTDGPTTDPPSPPTEAADRSVSSPTTTAGQPSTTTTPHCTPVVGLAADVDDDGCPDPVVIEGTTITAGSIVFRAGDADDHVTVGDWRCTGRVTPGLVRPATGEVFLFHHWPDDDTPLEADPVAIVPGGARLVASDGACGAPSVASTGGEVTHLNLTGDAG